MYGTQSVLPDVYKRQALRDALSLLDQCIIKSGESRIVDEQVVGDTAGLASKEYIYSMITAIREKNISLILSNLDEIHNLSLIHI